MIWRDDDADSGTSVINTPFWGFDKNMRVGILALTNEQPPASIMTTNNKFEDSDVDNNSIFNEEEILAPDQRLLWQSSQLKCYQDQVVHS